MEKKEVLQNIGYPPENWFLYYLVLTYNECFLTLTKKKFHYQDI